MTAAAAAAAALTVDNAKSTPAPEHWTEHFVLHAHLVVNHKQAFMLQMLLGFVHGLRNTSHSLCYIFSKPCDMEEPHHLPWCKHIPVALRRACGNQITCAECDAVPQNLIPPISDQQILGESRRWTRFELLYGPAIDRLAHGHIAFTHLVAFDSPDRTFSHPLVFRVWPEYLKFVAYIQVRGQELEPYTHELLFLPHSNEVVQNYLNPILTHILRVLKTVDGSDGDRQDFAFVLCRALGDAVQNPTLNSEQRRARPAVL